LKDLKLSSYYLVVLQKGPNAVLTVSTTKDARLSSLFFGRKRDGDDDEPSYGYPFIPPSPPSSPALIVREIPSDTLTGKDINQPSCKHCGATISEGQTICHECGKKIV